jgi:hypothetical protein
MEFSFFYYRKKGTCYVDNAEEILKVAMQGLDESWPTPYIHIYAMLT